MHYSQVAKHKLRNFRLLRESIFVFVSDSDNSKEVMGCGLRKSEVQQKKCDRGAATFQFFSSLKKCFFEIVKLQLSVFSHFSEPLSPR